MRPGIIDYLDEACAAHFARVRGGPRRARASPTGSSPVWCAASTTTPAPPSSSPPTPLDAAQNAVGGGGRYDGLVEQPSAGRPRPGIGFGIGIERVLLACDAEGCFPADPRAARRLRGRPDRRRAAARDLVAELRRAGLGAERAYDGRSLKAQLKQADRSGRPVRRSSSGPRSSAAGVVTAAAAAPRRARSGRCPGTTVVAVVRRRAGRPDDERGASDAVSATGMRTHLCGELRPEHVGHAGDGVRLGGAPARARRAAGLPRPARPLAASSSAWSTAPSTSAASGCCASRAPWRLRPEGTVNPELATGEVELTDCEVEVLAEAEPPPFPVDDRADVRRVGAPALPLRRPAPSPHAGATCACAAGCSAPCGPPWSARASCEVETPLLWTPTPEGAREFAVPSRLHRGRLLRAAAEPADRQAAAHGGGDRPLLPDRPVPARRGPARRSPVRVHPARHRDVVRHPGATSRRP